MGVYISPGEQFSIDGVGGIDKCIWVCTSFDWGPEPKQKKSLLQPLWNPGWRLLKELKPEQSYDPAISLLDVYPRKEKHYTEKIYPPHVHCSIVYSSQDMVSISE